MRTAASVRTTKLTCKETIRLICEYLDGRLSPGVAGELRMHLDDCKNCRMVLDAAQKTLATYFDSYRPPAPAAKARVA